jgi:hypothetical protein
VEEPPRPQGLQGRDRIEQELVFSMAVGHDADGMQSRLHCMGIMDFPFFFNQMISSCPAQGRFMMLI